MSSKNNFLKTDLSEPIDVERQFDLAISMEVAEHIEERKSDQFIKSLTDLAPVVLFSAAIPLQGGVHHVNEQWPDYWKEKFAKKDYILIDCIRPKVWNDARIKVWYIQNSFLFVKRDIVDNYPGLAKYRSDTTMLSVVHPRLYNFKLITWPIKKAVKNSLKRLFSKEKIRS
jgi:hypothetical protein